MVDLFDNDSKERKPDKNLPLAVRMRPRTFEEFIGQNHIVGEGKLLRRAIESDRLFSVIFYGPPGTGKTALGHVISNITKSYFEQLNATSSNAAELRNSISLARKRKKIENKKSILFIDEIHRFNKAQQDILMPFVEEANPILIGATTHNPFFSIVSALVSRSMIFQFKSLSEENIVKILKNAVQDKERGLGSIRLKFDEDAFRHLAKICDGDARRALNALEIGALTTPADKKGFVHFTLKIAEESIQKKAVVYDKDEDGHYDTVSAFIKSMRGSDPDSALYWLAKMIHAGEDPRFVARRIVICAAEDVGNADPQALVVANSALQISEFVGLPECTIPLAQAVTYIACAPKSNASYMGIHNALKDVEEERTQAVPDRLKDAGYHGAKELGHGVDYKYVHNYKNHYVKQSYTAKTVKYYVPADIGYEKKIKDYLLQIRSQEPK